MENSTVGFIILGSIMAMLHIFLIALQKIAKIEDAKKEEYRLYHPKMSRQLFLNLNSLHHL